MLIHKLGKKQNNSKNYCLLDICWKPANEVKLHPPQKINPKTWKVYCNEKIYLEPKSAKPVKLGLGYIKSQGLIIVSLVQQLQSCCSILNGSLIEDDIDDIVIQIYNDSKKRITLSEGQDLSFIHFVN